MTYERKAREVFGAITRGALIVSEDEAIDTLAAALREAVEEERSECAALAEREARERMNSRFPPHDRVVRDGQYDALFALAAAIRARSD